MQASLTPHILFPTIAPPCPPLDLGGLTILEPKYSGALGFPFPSTFITFLGYLVAKINPKVPSLLMSKLPAEKLASALTLGLMVSFAMPLGTALFSSLAIWASPLAWDLCHPWFHYTLLTTK